MVWGLAVTETISYGVPYYSFAAFLLPMQHSLGYNQATLTGAFSLSVLLTGAAAIPAGPLFFLSPSPLCYPRRAGLDDLPAWGLRC